MGGFELSAGQRLAHATVASHQSLHLTPALPPAPLTPSQLQAEPGAGEPSKAQLMAERRARLQAGAAQLSVMLAGVVDGAAPPGDNPFKALMPGQ